MTDETSPDHLPPSWEQSLTEAQRARLKKLREAKSSFWLGAPTHRGDVEIFALVLQHRFENAKDTGVGYIDRVVDRQLNKARGLLTYNSLMLATSNLIGLEATFKVPVSVLALISCLFLMKMMYVEWGSIQTYEDWSADIADGVYVAAGRAKLLTASLAFSGVASLLLGFVIAFGIAKPAPPRSGAPAAPIPARSVGPAAGASGAPVRPQPPQRTVP